VKTIIVGYDDHPLARAALDRAVTLAAAEGARLVVVAVAEVPLTPEAAPTKEFLDGRPVSLELEQPPEVGEALERAHDLIAERGVEADFVWTAGEAATSLVDVAKEEEADLIVVGGHHQSRLGRLLDPGVAAGVERDAPCDVMVVEQED
jgi:nucleotide-binding universal stress UspA family protein